MWSHNGGGSVCYEQENMGMGFRRFALGLFSYIVLSGLARVRPIAILFFELSSFS